MKKLAWFSLVIIALLVSVGGCAKQPQESITIWVSSGASFDVDEIMYYGELGAALDNQGNVVSSSIVISPNSERISFADASGALNGKPTCVLDKTTGKKIITKKETLYYLQGGQIAFEKEYLDMGIDAQKITVPINILSDYLRPIFEQLIREHVSMQTEKE